MPTTNAWHQVQNEWVPVIELNDQTKHGGGGGHKWDVSMSCENAPLFPNLNTLKNRVFSVKSIQSQEMGYF